MLSKLPELWEKEIINIEKPVDWVQETSDQLIKDFTMLDTIIEEKMKIKLVNHHLLRS